MIFSTKAEYGVRLMVELGRHQGETAVSLTTIAEAEDLPRSYLERLVAKLRSAGLVVSSHGARGGYRLARPAEEITMDSIVVALEGAIAPMECFDHDTVRRVQCSRTDSDAGCVTRVLWTKVQEGIVSALQGTTLAELLDHPGKSATHVGLKAV